MSEKVLAEATRLAAGCVPADQPDDVPDDQPDSRAGPPSQPDDRPDEPDEEVGWSTTVGQSGVGGLAGLQL